MTKKPKKEPEQWGMLEPWEPWPNEPWEPLSAEEWEPVETGEWEQNAEEWEPLPAEPWEAALEPWEPLPPWGDEYAPGQRSRKTHGQRQSQEEPKKKRKN